MKFIYVKLVFCQIYLQQMLEHQLRPMFACNPITHETFILKVIILVFHLQIMEHANLWMYKIHECPIITHINLYSKYKTIKKTKHIINNKYHSYWDIKHYYRKKTSKIYYSVNVVKYDFFN